jgi:hypothetical protein
MEPRKLFAELKRRNVYKVAIAYAVVAWLLMQIATQVFSISRDSELADPVGLHRRTDEYMTSPREAYRTTAPPSARFDVSANSMPVLRSPITNVLFSPSVDHGPRDTSLNSTNRQSVISVSFNPR